MHQASQMETDLAIVKRSVFRDQTLYVHWNDYATLLPRRIANIRIETPDDAEIFGIPIGVYPVRLMIPDDLRLPEGL